MAVFYLLGRAFGLLDSLDWAGYLVPWELGWPGRVQWAGILWGPLPGGVKGVPPNGPWLGTFVPWAPGMGGVGELPGKGLGGAGLSFPRGFG